MTNQNISLHIHYHIKTYKINFFSDDNRKTSDNPAPFPSWVYSSLSDSQSQNSTLKEQICWTLSKPSASAFDQLSQFY